MVERLLGIGHEIVTDLGVGGIIGILTVTVLGAILTQWFFAFRARQRRVATMVALSKDRTLLGLTPTDLVRSTGFHIRLDAYDARLPGATSRPAPKRRPVSKAIAEVLKNRSKHRVLLLLGEPGHGKTGTLVSAWARHAGSAAAGRAPMFLVSLGDAKAIDTILGIGSPERERSVLLLDGLELDPKTSANPLKRLLEIIESCRGFRRIVVSARADLFESRGEAPREFAASTELESSSVGGSLAPGGEPTALARGFRTGAADNEDSEDDEVVSEDLDGDDSNDGDDSAAASAETEAEAAQSAATAESSTESFSGPKGQADTHEIRVVRLAALNAKQVQRYLKLRYPAYLIFRRWAASRIVTPIPVSGLSPLVMSQMPALIAHGKPLSQVADIYEAMVHGSIRREHHWIKSDALFEWSKRLALRAYRSIATGQGPVVPEIDVKTVSREDDLAYPNWRLGPDSLVSRAADGSLQFVHGSFAEYLYTIAFCSMSPEARRNWLCGDDVPWTSIMKSAALLRFARPLAPLSFADLRGASLKGRELADSSLWKAHLEEADLSGASLRRADLRGALLAGANLSGADLTEADLTGADLAGANLDGSLLRGTTLVSASMNPSAALSIAPPSAQLDEGLLVEPITGMRLAWIPGGRFQMGSAKELNESPTHPVRLSSFWMGRTPVTNRQYECFLQATGYERPPCIHDPRFSDPDQPVVGVSHADALAFCSWLAEASGLHVSLPTEAQWEYAARGTDGREYPWGAGRPDPTKACFAEDAFDGRPAKVGSFPPGTGPFGTLDQAGNVWEWCLDAWDENAYVKRARKGPKDTVDPIVMSGDAEVRSVRGGSWFFPAEDLRASFRGKTAAGNRDDDLGFRVVVLTTLAEVRDDRLFVDAAIAQANSILGAQPSAQ